MSSYATNMEMVQGGGARSDGERLMASYFRDRGWSFEYEPEIGGRHPDFLVNHPLAGAIVFEVYEPELSIPMRDLSEPAIEPLDHRERLQRAFDRRKRRQIRAAAEAGIPYVAVIAETNAMFGVRPVTLATAMFGALQHVIPIDTSTGMPAGDGYDRFGPGGKLKPTERTGVSAAAILTVFNPTKWKLMGAMREAVTRITPDDWDSDPRARIASLEYLQAAEERALRSGVFDPSARIARLTWMHNLFAKNTLEIGLGSVHDRYWAVQDAATWGLVAEGMSTHETDDSSSLF